ncbi:MAG: ectonucleotide pyrophosphatase/phosphodiesterase [Eubacteriales bacterium]|nr:ectonucleotide pyrophosphatase/phosphodiesterase [Eubacteriales bacterium]
MKRRLLVISIDSMVEEDIPVMMALPNFKRVLEKSSIVKKMESTYPTLTHSIHTSIMTGCYPEHHHIINNEIFIDGEGPGEWFEHASSVGVPTLADEAKRLGLKTAYVYWPLTLGAKHPWVLHRSGVHGGLPGETMQDTVRRKSTVGLLDEVMPAVSDCWEQPDRYHINDLFCARAVSYLTKTYQPDIIYTHLTLIDRTRHSRGVFSDALQPAYQFLDECIGIMLDAIEQTGLGDQTIINITSDHGHCDIDHVTSINRFLSLHGFVDYDEQGVKITDYRAYCHTASLSAQIYVKDHDPVVRDKVYKLLHDNMEYLGISEILTVRQCEERFHTNGNYDFMIESDGKASFSARANYTDIFTKCDISDYRTSVATHGHMPHKGVQPSFFLYNPFAKDKVVLEHGRIIDQAPTLAKLLGFDMPCADGKPIEELVDLSK